MKDDQNQNERFFFFLLWEISEQTHPTPHTPSVIIPTDLLPPQSLPVRRRHQHRLHTSPLVVVSYVMTYKKKKKKNFFSTPHSADIANTPSNADFTSRLIDPHIFPAALLPPPCSYSLINWRTSFSPPPSLTSFFLSTSA